MRRSVLGIVGPLSGMVAVRLATRPGTRSLAYVSRHGVPVTPSGSLRIWLGQSMIEPDSFAPHGVGGSPVGVVDAATAPAGARGGQFQSAMLKWASGTRHRLWPAPYSVASRCRSASVTPRAAPSSTPPSPSVSRSAAPPVIATIRITRPSGAGTQAAVVRS